MKRIAGLLCFGLLGAASVAMAQTEINSTTIFRFYEESTPGFSDKMKTPMTEYLRADVNAENGLGFHVAGWGNVFLDNTSEDAEADFTYGYLSYRTEKGNGLVKAGRFYEYLITGIEQLDGISGRTDLKGGFSVSAFAGAPSKIDADAKGNSIIGGQLNWTHQYLQLGVSALTEDGVETESAGNVEDDKREMLGAMFALTPVSSVMLTGNMSYNLVTEDVAEQRLLLSGRPTDKLSLTAEYRKYYFEDYFATTSHPVFEADEDGEEEQIGATVNYQLTKAIDVSAFYKYFDVTDETEGTRVGGQFRMRGKDALGAVQFMVVDAEESEYSYDEIRAYAEMHASKMATIGAECQVDLYDEEMYGEDTAYLLGANLNLHLNKSFDLNGAVSYETGPRYDKEVKGFVWLKYNLNI